MKQIVINGLSIGSGMPKICIPIVETTKEEILKEAKLLSQLECDIVEWRLDFYENILDDTQVIELLKQLKKILLHKVLLLTFRSHLEGGHQKITTQQYAKIYENIIISNEAMLIDLEIFSQKNIENLITLAHQNDVKVIGSHHNFLKTYSKEEIIHKFTLMKEMKCDIIKMALMPNHQNDVLLFLEATSYANSLLQMPIVSMSMGKLGLISRLAGEIFNSCITFGSRLKPSAPGQIEYSKLKRVLEIIHENGEIAK